MFSKSFIPLIPLIFSLCAFSFQSKLSLLPESKSNQESFRKKHSSQPMCFKDIASCRHYREESSDCRTMKKQSRRKKKHFSRFFFWMKLNFFSCTASKVEDPGWSMSLPKKRLCRLWFCHGICLPASLPGTPDSSRNWINWIHCKCRSSGQYFCSVWVQCHMEKTNIRATQSVVPLFF